MSALFSKVVQSLFAIYFLCKAKEPIVRSRSPVGDILEEAPVGSGEPDTMLLLEQPDRVLRQRRPKSITNCEDPKR
ncbi:hypothetical protein GCM10010228_79900 [Streptomyces massasporeus]|nr:hypothetical protein [Streptomyces massasporeus]GGV90785.1 hypothetical protein GCM10010228_79900 [Streptomyces massasporeus]